MQVRGQNTGKIQVKEERLMRGQSTGDQKITGEWVKHR